MSYLAINDIQYKLVMVATAITNIICISFPTMFYVEDDHNNKAYLSPTTGVFCFGAKGCIDASMPKDGLWYFMAMFMLVTVALDFCHATYNSAVHAAKVNCFIVSSTCIKFCVVAMSIVEMTTIGDDVRVCALSMWYVYAAMIVANVYVCCKVN